MTTTSTKKSSGKKYYYYKCVKKNKEGKTENHAPKDLSVSKLDNFVFKTMQLLLKEPELLKAMKKRAEFEGRSALEKLDHKIQRLNQDSKATRKEITNTKDVLKRDPGEKSEQILLNELENLALKKEELEDEIKFCEEEHKRFNDQHPIDNESYQDILDQFVSKWGNNNSDKRSDLVRTLVRTVTSYVDYHDAGNIEVKYIADKKLEAEWQKIKKCESGNVESIPVRTSNVSGSPGRTQTIVFSRTAFL